MGNIKSKDVPSRPKSIDGRPVVKADSRPTEATTYFTMRGDSASGIGDGTVLKWDFSTNDDIVTDSITTPIPDGYKRKRVKLVFVDPIRVKEGSLYWQSAPFGCYMDFWVVCPDGAYYLQRDGETPAQADGDTPIEHYVNHHMMCGDCPMGDELNTEAANENAIPPGYELWIEVTVSSNNSSFKGFGELEIYRVRTHLFPGESV